MEHCSSFKEYLLCPGSYGSKTVAMLRENITTEGDYLLGEEYMM
jgi:hypothetical protein